MQPDFWLERWQANEIGFHQDEVNLHLQTWWPQLGCPADSEILVPLCGKSRDMLWLAAQGHRVLGVELSEIAVQAFFEENDLTPTLTTEGAFACWQAGEIRILQGDFFKLDPSQTGEIAGVFDRASLIALPAEMRARYAVHMRHVLPASARVLLVTMDYPPAEMDGPPFPVTLQEVESLYAAGFRIEPQPPVDILAENPRFQARGLTRLQEQVFFLLP